MTTDLVGDDARLREVVRAVLAEPSARLDEWHAEPRQGGGRVNVIAGTAGVGDAERRWRVVVKQLPGADGVEARIHTSGLLDDLPGIRAPRCYGADQTADGGVRLWLEHVEEKGERAWTIERWALAARHLGRFNGAYLAGRKLPDRPWLRGGRLRAWLDNHVPLVERIAAAPDDPAVSHWWPRPTVDAILRLWAERGRFCDALERLPRTFGHGDAIRRNLIFGSDGLVAIDWEHAGLYAAGEEVGQALSVAAAFFDLAPADLPALDEALFAAYRDGLRDAGAAPEPGHLRFAYAAHAALRNLFNAVGTSVPPAAGAARALQTYGHTWDALAGRRAEIRPFLLERADEARRLMASL
jgi:hypothetical protein